MATTQFTIPQILEVSLVNLLSHCEEKSIDIARGFGCRYINFKDATLIIYTHKFEFTDIKVLSDSFIFSCTHEEVGYTEAIEISRSHKDAFIRYVV